MGADADWLIQKKHGDSWFNHARSLFVERDYNLFALINGLQRRDHKAVIPAKGWPKDLDGHDLDRDFEYGTYSDPYLPTWLTLAEAIMVGQRYRTLTGRTSKDWDGIVEMMRALGRDDGESVRLLFWCTH